MRILSAVFMGGLVAVAGGILYDTTFEVQDLEGRLNRINRQIIAEREQIQVLRADWSVLNDIRRVEDLAVRHLPDLRPAEPLQFATLADVPRRDQPAPAGDGPQVAVLPYVAGATKATPVVSADLIGTSADGIGGLINKMGSAR